MNHNHVCACARKVRLLAAGTVTAVLSIGALCLTPAIADSSGSGPHTQTLSKAGTHLAPARKEY